MKQHGKRSIHRSRVLAPSVFAFVVALATMALTAVPAGAVQTHLFKESFGSAAQPLFTNAKGMTVIQSSGDLLVVDRNADGSGTLTRWAANGETDPFSALGTNVIDGAKGPGGKPCAEESSSCDATPAGGFDGLGGNSAFPVQVAVDESGTATNGNIYVLESESKRIDIFAADGHYLGQLTKFGTKNFGEISGLDVDSGGNVYVSDRSKDAIHKFSPSANPPVNGDFATDFKAVGRPDALAVGAGNTAGYLFVTRHSGTGAPNSGGLFKLKLSNGELQYPILEGFFAPEEILTVSVDPGTGHLFVLKNEGSLAGSEGTVIKEYDASGASSAALLSITRDNLRNPISTAVDGASGEFYAGFGNALTTVKVFSAPIVTLPDVVTTTPPTAVTPSKATVHGTVNPDGQAVTECVFEYGPGDTNKVFAYEHTVPCAESEAEIGTGHAPVPVEARLTGLPSNQSGNVHFRLVAKNGNDVKVFGSDKNFLTTHTAVTEPATGVTGAAATLHGTVNPDGSAVTECRFEYLPESGFVNEVQTVTLAGASGGTFKLSFQGEETGGEGEGRLTGGSTTVTEVSAASGTFAAPGEAIAGAGIKPNTTIAHVVQEAGIVTTLTLSQATEATVPATKTPLTADLSYSASAESVRNALRALPSIEGSGLAVSGAAGGPYTIEFSSGALAATNVPQLAADASGLTPSGATATPATVKEGEGWANASSEPCAESGAEIGAGESTVPVHAQIESLATGVTYRFRLSAANAADGPDHGSARSFFTLQTVETKPATEIGGSVAMLNGTVNPASQTVGECLFQYVDDAGYEPLASNPYVAGQTVPCAESEAEIGTGTSPVPVHAAVSGLQTHTKYHFRLLAGPSGAAGVGDDEEFATRGPGIEAQWAADVTAAEAIVKAQINPGGSATTYHLDWGPTAAPYAHSSTDSASIGADEGNHTVAVTLSELEADAAYHYRFVATSHCNPLEPAEVCVFEGSDHTLHTSPPAAAPSAGCPNQRFRTGAAAGLPDCRAYEMVSPVDKNNGDVVTGPPNPNSRNVPQAADSGQRMAFSSLTSFGDPQGAHLASQYVASRDPGAGWSTESISPPRGGVSLYPLAGSTDIPFKVFSGDLCSGWILQSSDVALAPGAPPGVPNLYRRDNCGGGGFELLSNAAPPGFSLEPFDSHYYPDIMGFSADGARSVFRADAALTPDADPQKELFQVYEAYDGGKLRLVSVLPDGSAAAVNSAVGTAHGTQGAFRENSVHHAVSKDGSRVFWSAPSATGFTGPGRLYVRLNATELQSEISAGKCIEPAKACTIAVSESPETTFRDADSEGKTAIYTVGEALFEFDVETETPHLIATGVEGVMGASDDASRIYFASTDLLAPGATAGKPNLYLYRAGGGGSFAFLATLSSADALNPVLFTAPPSPIASISNKRASRVSPDGLHAAFASTQSLTGYDNDDASNGEADAEVFAYDATANGGAGELACASCNPSGARPQGREVQVGANGNPGPRAAALIPGWSTQFQPTRALSEDGARLFFNSYDALLPGDTNGRMDVYEWEAPGSGECTEGNPSYFETNGGCLWLITSGQSPKDSEFFDASPSGDDVFFATNSSLLPQDPGLTDVYDARVNGGFPPPPPPPPPCVGDACQSVPPPPNDQTPASVGFRGAGNLRSHAVRGCPKGKRKVVRRGKARCVRKRGEKSRGHKRRAHRHHGRAAR